MQHFGEYKWNSNDMFLFQLWITQPQPEAFVGQCYCADLISSFWQQLLQIVQNVQAYRFQGADVKKWLKISFGKTVLEMHKLGNKNVCLPHLNI
jgi:hypothetical protein